jgi:DNA-3-methyladenine glycosylase I
MSETYCRLAPDHAVHAPYHDREYGFPVRDENALFERLMLEVNQAGLSAFAGFDVDRVAAFDPTDIERLLADPGIIRNRLKIEAAIDNARRIQALRDAHGSFAGWLDAHHPRSPEDWVKLFKKSFRFTGGQIVGEFLISTGYLPGAHAPFCPVYARILEREPPWSRPLR